MHGYLELTCLFDSLTRDKENEVKLTFVRFDDHSFIMHTLVMDCN
jgi:hypothetical protein